MRITVKAKPGSKKGDLVSAISETEYEVHLKQKPLEGKANEALIKLLANHFSVRQRDVRIVSGLTARIKIVEIENPA